MLMMPLNLLILLLRKRKSGKVLRKQSAGEAPELGKSVEGNRNWPQPKPTQDNLVLKRRGRRQT
jgi:hypothetical protein